MERKKTKLGRFARIICVGRGKKRIPAHDLAK